MRFSVIQVVNSSIDDNFTQLFGLPNTLLNLGSKMSFWMPTILQKNRGKYQMFVKQMPTRSLVLDYLSICSTPLPLFP